MIFIATDADASALNLGKVSFKTIEDVSQETYEVIAAYGNKNFTDDQIIAIDDFLIQLKNLPTYSRFNYCVLPILAPTTQFLGETSAWKDNNPCYDIINKERLIPGGYNGYVDNHGIKMGKDAGMHPVIQNNTPLSINPSIFTMGIGEWIDSEQMGYVMSADRRYNKISFGATGKLMEVNCNEAITEGLPCVSVGSRNATEVHGVINGKVGSYNGEIKEPYATNPYSMKNAAGIFYHPTIEGFVCSFVFFCKDYMMNEKELLEVNKIFYDLMKALW